MGKSRIEMIQVSFRREELQDSKYHGVHSTILQIRLLLLKKVPHSQQRTKSTLPPCPGRFDIAISTICGVARLCYLFQ